MTILDSFRELADASLSRIHQMARDPELPVPVYFYSQFMSAFMVGDVEKMQKLQLQMDSLLEKQDPKISEDLKKVVNLRMKLRQKTLTQLDVEKAFAEKYFDVLEAEKLFVIARAWEMIGDDTKAMLVAVDASVVYKKCQCPKKALRSFYNSVAAESRMTPYKNFSAEFQTIIKMAQEVGDKSFAGMGLSMLSREYQIIGLHESALKYINEGIEYMIEERGSAHYYHALLQKAHLLIESKKEVEATMLLMECRLASFPEVRAARELLECALNPKKTWSSDLEKDLNPTWKERLPELLVSNTTQAIQIQEGPTLLEFKILKTLWSGPIPKWELIERLYPDEKDSYIVENRFKNLVARLRKKYPEVLQFAEGKYFIQHKNKLDLSVLIGEMK